jgi:hypothetical protein
MNSITTITYLNKKYNIKLKEGEQYLSIHHIINDLYKNVLSKELNLFTLIYIKKIIEEKSYLIQYKDDSLNDQSVKNRVIDINYSIGLYTNYILIIPYHYIIFFDLFLLFFSFILIPYIFISIFYFCIKYLYKNISNFNYTNQLLEYMIYYDIHVYLFSIFYLFGIISLIMIMYYE